MLNKIKEIISDISIKNILNDIGIFTYRNSIWLGILLIVIYVFNPTNREWNTGLLIIANEMIAISLSLIITAIFTKLKFLQKSTAGADMKYSVYERQALTQTIGLLWLAVHILVGLCVFSVYLAQFSGAGYAK